MAWRKSEVGERRSRAICLLYPRQIVAFKPVPVALSILPSPLYAAHSEMKVEPLECLRDIHQGQGRPQTERKRPDLRCETGKVVRDPDGF